MMRGIDDDDDDGDGWIIGTSCLRRRATSSSFIYIFEFHLVPLHKAV